MAHTWCNGATQPAIGGGSHMVQCGTTTCQRGRGGSGAEQKVEGGKGGSCLSLSFAERARHETCGKFAKVNRPRTCSGLGTCNGQEVRVGTAGNGGVTHRNGLDISEAGIDLHAAQ